MKKFLRNNYLSLIGGFLKPVGGVHIINAHYVTKYPSSKEDFIVFEGFLRYLTAYSDLINLEEAVDRILKKEMPKGRPLICLTFDDGYEECYTTIAPLLEKYNTRGAFFINANYIGSNKVYQNEFNKRVSIEVKKPMDWDQVVDLYKRGHSIGSHTLDHYNIASLDDERLNEQIYSNKSILESKLQYSCDYFAWPYGQNQHFPDNALQTVASAHKYIFSGTDYKMYLSRNGQIINRRHIEPYWPKSHINFFLSTIKRF